MKARFESIQYSTHKASYHFFRREDDHFPSYWHFHPELELTYIDQGRGIRYIGDDISSYKPGDLVLIGQNLPHDYVTTGEDGRGSVAYVFQFPYSLADSFPECHRMKNLFNLAVKGIHVVDPGEHLVSKIKAASQLSELKGLINLLDVLEDLACRDDLTSLSDIAFVQKQTSLPYQGKISQVIKHVSTEYPSKISLDQMAQFTSMTKESFCRWFKKSTGSTFITYLNSTRVEKACQYLLEGEKSIGQIGYEVGFDTASHFNRVFKKLKGKTPKEYIKDSRSL